MNLFRIVALALTLLTSTSAMAAGVAVFPVRGSNLGDGEVDAIGVLIAQAYRDAAQQQVLEPSQTLHALNEAGSPQAAAQLLGVDEYLDISAVQLSSTISVSAARYAASGAQIHSVKAVAASLDDMENVSVRVARALVNLQTLAETRDVRTVTKKEGEVPNRTFSEKMFGVRTGFMAGLAVDQALEPMASLAFDMRFEMNQLFFELAFGFFVAPDAYANEPGYGGLFLDLGAYYHLIDADVAPYVGGGISPRLILNSDNVLNFAPKLAVGVMVPRTASTRFYAEIAAYQNVLPVRLDTDDNFFTSRTIEAYPTEVGLNVGIGF